MKIAVLIPCYNEAPTIQKVVRDYKKALPEADIYVYDNNSTDGTGNLAKEAGAIVRQEHKQGKGNVVRSMFRDIDADCYVITDGDDTYPAEDAVKLVELVKNEGCDMAIGDRLSSTYFTENKRPFHNSGNRMVRSLINLIYHCDIQDIMTGSRAFSRDFVKSFPVLSRGFEIETEMTIFAMENNMKVGSAPINYRDRPAGSFSKLNTLSDGVKVLATIGRFFRDNRPFACFGLLTLILGIITLGLFFPIWNDFLHTGTVEKIPTLIMVCMLGIATLLCFFTGLILTSMRKSQKDAFERSLTILRNQSSILRELHALEEAGIAPDPKLQVKIQASLNPDPDNPNNLK